VAFDLLIADGVDLRQLPCRPFQHTRAEFETIGADGGCHVANVLDVPNSPLTIIELDPSLGCDAKLLGGSMT